MLGALVCWKDVIRRRADGRRLSENLAPDRVGRDAGLGTELRQVEEEALADDPVVLEGELDEDRQLGPLAVRRDPKAVSGHGHLHKAPANQRVVIGGMALQDHVVVREHAKNRVSTFSFSARPRALVPKAGVSSSMSG
jgi:hypothetical protein